MRRMSLAFSVAVVAVAVSAETPPASTGTVFPEARRQEVIETLARNLQYTPRAMEDLRLLPDPFRFTREIQEEEPEQVVEGLSDEEVLEVVAATLSANIVGYQDFGGRSFFATRDYGLLREGTDLTLELKEQPGQPVGVRILDPSRAGFTIRISEGVETFVPVGGNPAGISPNRSDNP